MKDKSTGSCSISLDAACPHFIQLSFSAKPRWVPVPPVRSRVSIPALGVDVDGQRKRIKARKDSRHIFSFPEKQEVRDGKRNGKTQLIIGPADNNGHENANNQNLYVKVGESKPGAKPLLAWHVRGLTSQLRGPQLAARPLERSVRFHAVRRHG
jgi:hypothetical protein